MFKALKKFLKFAAERPFLNAFAVLISATLVFAALAAMFAMLCAIIVPPLLRDRIGLETGFHFTSCESVYNVFDGTCRFKGAEFKNPQKYGQSSFAKFSNLEIQFSLLDFVFRPRIEIYSFKADLQKLSCVINITNEYNLKEFVSGFMRFTYADESFTYFTVSIEEYDYKNVTEGDSIQWTRKLGFNFDKNSGGNFAELSKQLCSNLDNSNASFISKPLWELIKASEK